MEDPEPEQNESGAEEDYYLSFEEITFFFCLVAGQTYIKIANKIEFLPAVEVTEAVIPLLPFLRCLMHL